MGKLSSAAKEITSGIPVIAGLEKITTDLVIAGYPNGITVTGADLLDAVDQNTGEAKKYGVVTFQEDVTKYMPCGQQLTEIIEKWFEITNAPDGMQLSAALRQEGGVKIKLEKSRTQGGRSFTKATVIEG